MKKVFILGGAGFIGRHLVQGLLQRGDYSIVICDNFTRGIPTHSVHGIEVMNRDIRDKNIDIALIGADTVVNLAAISSVRVAEKMQDETRSVNATSLKLLMNAARKAGVKRFLQASSREVYGNPNDIPVPESCPLGGVNHYGRSKEEAERILSSAEMVYDIPVTLLRLANVIGTNDVNDGRVIPRWITQARKGIPLTVYGGTSKSLDFIPVEYVVSAFIRAIEREQPLTTATPINIGSGTNITLADVARYIGARFPGTTVQIQPSQVTEVEHFAANTRRMEALLEVAPPKNPLKGIENFRFVEPAHH